MSMNAKYRYRGYVLPLVILMIPLVFLLLSNLSRNALEAGQLGAVGREQGEVFFLAETGLNIGEYLGRQNNFQAFTATRNLDAGGLSFEEVNSNMEALTSLRLGVSPVLIDEDEALLGLYNIAPDPERDGWYAVTPLTEDENLSGSESSGLNEELRFALNLLTADDTSGMPRRVGWEVLSEAVVGGKVRRHRVVGAFESLGDYTYFDAGTALFDVSAGASFSGPVHANGDFHVSRESAGENSHIVFNQSPEFTKQELVTCSGDFLKTGNGLKSATRYITSAKSFVQPLKHNGEPDTLVELRLTDGTSQDDWLSSGPEGALQRFGGAIKDGSLGTKLKNTPSFDTVAPGGYYDIQSQRGGLKVDDALVESQASLDPKERFIRKEQMFMASEGRYVEAYVLDIDLLNTSGIYPQNGLVYTEGHLLVRHGDELVGDLSVVAQGNVVVAGDYNDDSAQDYSAMIYSGNRVIYAGDNYGQVNPADRDSGPQTHEAWGAVLVNSEITDENGVKHDLEFYGKNYTDKIKGLNSASGPACEEYVKTPSGEYRRTTSSDPVMYADGGESGLNYHMLAVSSQPADSWYGQRKFARWKTCTGFDIGKEMIMSNYAHRMRYPNGNGVVPLELHGGQIYTRSAKMVDIYDPNKSAAERNNPGPGEQAYILGIGWDNPERFFSYERSSVGNIPFVPMASIRLLWQSF